MHHVSANYTLPTVLNTLQPAAVSAVRKAVNAKASTAPTTGTNSGIFGHRYRQHLPEFVGDGIAESRPHGSGGFNRDGRPDDLTQPARPAHQYQSDRHRVHRHRIDGVAAASGGDCRQCSALLSQWRRRQYPFAFGSGCSGQPTPIRPQYPDAPELRDRGRARGRH